MLYGWNKFKGWVVLEYFLESNKKIHVNGLAKDLKISPSTAQAYLSEYEKEGILEREKTANIITYKLNETPFTLELKKLYIISKILSFAFRLFGNIFAGEVLLAVIAFLMPFIVPLPFLALELFVGFIQALVFSMLTAVFLNVAVSHGESEHAKT